MRKYWQALKKWGDRYRVELAVGALVFLADQITKTAVMWFLPDTPVKITPFFQLRYVENTGAAFGMMQGGNLVLIFIMLAIIAYILKSWKELCAHGAAVRWGCVFILAGAIGNLYDRIMLGYVVDFLDFLVWPVFNVADSFITVGGCLFAWSLLFTRPKKQEEK